LLFAVFLVPLALYFLLLGWINRQPRPVLLSGTVDLIGVLFAASGFLLLGGPAILSTVHENWRLFWVLGDTGNLGEGLDGARQTWLLHAGLYFAIIIVVSAWLFWRRRGTTCIYNVEPATVETTLMETFQESGVHATLQANRFELRENKTVVELDTFPALMHVTLRWSPQNAPLRALTEAALERKLADHGAPYHETGAWLGLFGSALLVLSMVIAFAVVLRTFLSRG
jgi:hypothetical protein